jgi:hypothetical protein
MLEKDITDMSQLMSQKVLVRVYILRALLGL